MVNLFTESQGILDSIDMAIIMSVARQGRMLSVSRPNWYDIPMPEREWVMEFYKDNGKWPYGNYEIVVFHYAYSETLRQLISLGWEVCSAKRYNTLLSRSML